MKILHVSDTHLGYSAYRKTTAQGINQREIDVYNAFKEFIDYAVKNKPDLVLHSGDLFDSVRPNNRAITFAIKQILRLSDNNIPFVVIAGNHEHPKLRETGSILSIFDHIKNVCPVYNEKYETHSFIINKQKITIHAVPQCSIKQDFEKEIKKIKTDKKSDYNILMVHGAVKGIHAFSMNEFNELFIPTETLSNDFDYIALGHYHKYSKIAKNTYYSGATESLSFTDSNDKKGFIELTLDKQKTNITFIPLKTRPMIDVPPIKCSKLRLEQVMEKIKKTVKEIKPQEKTFRIVLEDISPEIYRGLDFNEIRKLSHDAVHYEIKVDIAKDKEKRLTGSSKIDALAREFELFLKNQDVEDKKLLLEIGIGYIEKIEARDEGK